MLILKKIKHAIPKLYKDMKRAVILANLGAPSRLEEVRPFLKNLFSDPDIFHFPFGKIGQYVFSSLIAKFRTPKSSKYYAAIGGGSPLHENTVKQAEKLQTLLNKEGDYSVFVAQRYWNPFIHEIIGELKDQNFEEIILLPLYPHYSTTSTLSIVKEWERTASDLPQPLVIQRFFERTNYNKVCAKKIREKIDLCEHKPHILFSAHSIPQKRVDEGDPYQEEIQQNMELIMDELGKDTYTYSLCYQSRVGPVKWLEPTVEDEVIRLVDNGITSVVLFPISFVSEHLETLYELDIQKKEAALASGIIEYIRADTVGDDDDFIDVLKDLVMEIS